MLILNQEIIKPQIEIEEASIRSCTTIHEINSISESLLQELEKIKDNKYTSASEMTRLKAKLILTKETRTHILSQLSSVKEIVPKKPNKKPTLEPTKIHSQLYNHLKNMKATKSVDILLLFHSYDLNRVEMTGLFDFQLTKLKTRFALGYYYYLDEKLENICFEISRFADIQRFKSQAINDITKIKAGILSLDWSNKAHKLVINCAQDYVYITDDIGANKHVETIISCKDDIGKQLKAASICMMRESLSERFIERSTIAHLTSDSFLAKPCGEIHQVFYLKELYFLKRHLFAKFDDYQRSRVFTATSDQYKDFPSYATLEFHEYKKENAFSEAEIESTRMCEIEIQAEVTAPVSHLFLTWAAFYGITSKGYVWLEILIDEATFKRVLDIHLTTECLVTSFRTKCACISIEIARMSRLVLDSKWITSVFTEQKLSESEIVFPSESAVEVMKSFTHFTYEQTSSKLMIFDLRTLEFESNKYLITEPVVFSDMSLGDRFGSSDLGPNGMESFKAEHICNSICRTLGLQSFA